MSYLLHAHPKSPIKIHDIRAIRVRYADGNIWACMGNTEADCKIHQMNPPPSSYSTSVRYNKYFLAEPLSDGYNATLFYRTLTASPPALIPASVAYHVIGHVLAGNDTTPLGEIQQSSFQGGNRREGGFFFIQFVILQFHHGIKISPVVPGEKGNFDPEKILWAIHRGANTNVDITHQWDFWPLMSLPLQQARQKCALLPKLEEIG